jgi:hypothetical protein
MIVNTKVIFFYKKCGVLIIYIRVMFPFRYIEDQAVRSLFLFINKEVNKRKVSNGKGTKHSSIVGLFSSPKMTEFVLLLYSKHFQLD